MIWSTTLRLETCAPSPSFSNCLKSRSTSLWSFFSRTMASVMPLGSPGIHPSNLQPHGRSSRDTVADGRGRHEQPARRQGYVRGPGVEQHDQLAAAGIGTGEAERTGRDVEPPHLAPQVRPQLTTYGEGLAVEGEVRAGRTLLGLHRPADRLRAE